MRRIGLLAVLAIALTCTSADAGIVTNFTGGAAPGNAAGGGNLQSIFNSAAAAWEAAIPELCTFTVTINFGWGAAGGSTLGFHSLGAQGGVPNRETVGNITFDNDGSSVFFMDATPTNNSEYTTFTSFSADLGGGTMNTGNIYTGATGLAAGRIDLYSVALHEIGHALGLSGANTAFQAESIPDSDIDVTFGAFNGATIPTFGANAHINVPSALMFPSISAGQRRLISTVDIIANAQISQWDLTPKTGGQGVPEPLTGVLAGIGFLGVALLRRKKAA